MFNESQELLSFKSKLQGFIEYVRQELQTLKTGKASPSFVENMIVETYGGTTKLKIQELATISTDGAQGLVLSPFDPSTVQDIEKAILTSPLHLTPQVEGKIIRIKIPPLTEDQRRQMTKLVGSTVEEGKNKIRFGRDDIRKTLKQSFEDKTISEDQRFRIEKDVEKITQDASSTLDEIKIKKENELMSI